MGFDPYIGFYHQLDYGRPSLALDLLEELRAPLVDRFTAKVLNQGTLTRDDFVSSPQGGVYLGQEAKRTFFAAWERELSTPFAAGRGGAELPRGLPAPGGPARPGRPGR